MAGGQEVTVPVKDNVWAYQGKKDLIGAVPLTVHFTDGSTAKAIGVAVRPSSGVTLNLRGATALAWASVPE
jgi:hypothetical protein